MDCSLAGSSVHGILQARILEWAVISSSRGSSQPRDLTSVSMSPALQADSLLLSHWRRAMTFLDSTYKWYYTVCVFLWLIQRNFFKNGSALQCWRLFTDVTWVSWHWLVRSLRWHLCVLWVTDGAPHRASGSPSGPPVRPVEHQGNDLGLPVGLKVDQLQSKHFPSFLFGWFWCPDQVQLFAAVWSVSFFILLPSLNRPLDFIPTLPSHNFIHVEIDFFFLLHLVISWGQSTCVWSPVSLWLALCFRTSDLTSLLNLRFFNHTVGVLKKVISTSSSALL